MKWVIDASVAAKWLAPEPDTPLAEALLADDLIAPDLLYAEVPNTLWKKQLRGEMDAATTQIGARWLLQVPLQVHDSAGLLARLFHKALCAAAHGAVVAVLLFGLGLGGYGHAGDRVLTGQDRVKRAGEGHLHRAARLAAIDTGGHYRPESANVLERLGKSVQTNGATSQVAVPLA